MESKTPAAERFPRVVVPIDGSDASKAALVYATHIPCDELVLVHVAVDREVIVPDWVLHNDRERHEATFGEAMEDLAAHYREQGFNVSVDMRTGDVAEEIIQAGKSADLIVMMTHGRGAAGRIIFGSMADRVVRHSETPVLLVRVGELTRHPRMPKRITLTLDGSHLAEKAIPTTIRMAKATGLPVQIVRSVGLQDVKARLRDLREHGQVEVGTKMSPTLYDDTLAAIRSEAQAYIDGVGEQLRAEGIEVTTELLEGSVPFTIMYAVNPDDLLILTTRGQGGYKRWALGSNAEKLIREAPCPVLLERGPEDVSGHQG